MDKYGIVYLWRDSKHKRYYVGCHWGHEDDGYVCSSSWMMQAYRIRPTDFKRKILARIYDRKELLKEENMYLGMIKDAELKTKYYNIYNREFGHWSTDEKRRNVVKEKVAWNRGLTKHNNESVMLQSKKASATLKGRSTRNPWSKEQREAKSAQMRISRPNGFFTGKKHSDESKLKMSNAKQGKVGSFAGKKHSDESKLKMSNAKQGKVGSFAGKKHSDESKLKIRLTKLSKRAKK